MTEKEAYQILGLSPEAEINDIKKRYRQLMLTAHPDAGSSRPVPDARKLNAAYAVLKKKTAGRHFQSAEKTFRNGNPKSGAPKKTAAWDAPVNSSAYRDREILHYAENQEGAVLGTFCIARGKYLWKTQEDFPLFLLSIYRCSARILDELDESLSRSRTPSGRLSIQAELSYLLALQFMDAEASLKELAHVEKSSPAERPVYRLSAMLEYGREDAHGRSGLRSRGPFLPDEPLYPSSLRRHRLYLKDRSGRELGYLSFPDDRFYYIVIPLFEQKRVQVRIKTSSHQTAGGKSSAPYQNLKLWLRFSDGKQDGPPENLNLRIERLLEKYRSPACP